MIVSMAASGRWETSGDYLDFVGDVAAVDLREVLNVLFSTSSADWDTAVFPVLRLGEHIELVVDYGCEGPDTARIAIAVGDGDAGTRHALAKLVYDELCSRTEWAVHWTSDESVGEPAPQVRARRLVVVR